MQRLLDIENLRTTFDIHVGKVQAVRGVNLHVDEGETVGVVGESGCGKSTVGKMLLDIYHPTSGRIFYEGTDITNLSAHERRPYIKKMQLVWQDPYSSLDPRMRAGDIIAEGMENFHLVSGRSERQAKVEQLMKMCGLYPEMATHYPHQFSGGQRQRIGIARSLAVKPKFVVCDEAVSALDVSIQSQIINLLADLKEQSNLTYLFITHDLSVVKYISDRIGVMYLGNMVELANTQELFDHPLHPYTEALMAAIPTTDVEENRELRILEGDIPSPVNPPQGCKFHTRCAHCTEICKHAVPEWKEMAPGHFVACHHPLSEKE